MTKVLKTLALEKLGSSAFLYFEFKKRTSDDDFTEKYGEKHVFDGKSGKIVKC
jgi:hypothetical protein